MTREDAAIADSFAMTDVFSCCGENVFPVKVLLQYPEPITKNPKP
jgi:hypothetical protein